MVFEELQNSELADFRHRIRHSAAHIMADIVCQLFPGAILGIGPPTEDGFYYDFDIGRAFTPDDLIAIEEGMKKVISNDIAFVREEISREEFNPVILPITPKNHPHIAEESLRDVILRYLSEQD